MNEYLFLEIHFNKKLVQQNWFANWFDSPYYHLLYKHRNYEEAEFFISNLFNYLSLPYKSKVLDLACGKGRHSRQIHNLGYDVLGIDLSPESISAASEYSEDGLNFQTGDMREIGYEGQFDAVVNLFTSFGYFQEEGDNKKVIKSIASSLKGDGVLVLDYLNVAKAEQNLPSDEVIEREGISFKIEKKIEESFIVKNINFSAEQNDFHFSEYVKRFGLDDFKEIFSQCGLVLQEVFGSYSLEEFHENSSDRLILIAKKAK